MDEVHFQQHGSRCRRSIPPDGIDPVLHHRPTCKSVKYFGAVRLGDGKFVFRREEGSFDAVSCHAFLRQLWRATQRSGRRAIGILDNARYHPARLHLPWRQERGNSLRLHFTSAPSPELNPIERVGRLT
jgi:hypothetical protein